MRRVATLDSIRASLLVERLEASSLRATATRSMGAFAEVSGFDRMDVWIDEDADAAAARAIVARFLAEQADVT